MAGDRARCRAAKTFAHARSGVQRRRSGKRGPALGWSECVGRGCWVRFGSRCEYLFAEDVGVPRVLREFSKYLEEERPHLVLSSAVDNCVEFVLCRGLTRLLTSMLVCLLN
jgi:hypothetical protein